MIAAAAGRPGITMTVVIAGGSGFLGRTLTARLRAAGHAVTILTRAASPAGDGLVTWQPDGTTGAWAGALEALKAKWCPVFVRAADAAPKGNTELLKLGALPLAANELANIDDLQGWFATHATPHVPNQAELF